MHCDPDDGNDTFTMVDMSLDDEAADEEYVAVEAVVCMHLTLTQKDQEVLLNPAGWLNDCILQAAQSLWKSSSLVLVASKYTFRADTQLYSAEERILHTCHGHWLTVSTLGLRDDGQVMVYDSLFSTVSLHVKKQIAACFEG